MKALWEDSGDETIPWGTKACYTPLEDHSTSECAITRMGYDGARGFLFMGMIRTKSLYIVVGLTIANLLIGAFPLIAEDDCKTLQKVLADAFSKVHSMATHVYTVTKIGSQTFTSEIIYADGSMYMKINDKWRLSGSIKEMAQAEQQAKKNANSKDSCRQLKDELVNGDMAAVYSSHSETAKGSLDMQMWVSKATGQILRQDTNSDGGKVVLSSRYEYENVKAPL